VGAALTLPALAVAADALARRRRVLLPAALAAFVVGVPANIGRFDAEPFGSRYFEQQEQLLAGVAWSPLATEVPRDTLPEPDPFLGDDLTIGWLLDVRAEGKLPAPGPIPDALRRTFPLRLGLVQRGPTPEEFANPDQRCLTTDGSDDVTVVPGDLLGVAADSFVRAVGDDGELSPPLRFTLADGLVFDVQLPLTLRIDGQVGDTIDVCVAEAPA
jgi:hypothetical protein